MLAPLKSMIGSAPSYSFIGANSYLSAMEIEAGCSGLSIAACHLTTQNPAGRLGREAYSAKSSYVNAPIDDASVASFIAAVENLHAHAPTVGGGLAFDAYGGAINRVASDATAFVHRDKLACIQATYSWSSYTSPSVIAAGAQWLTWLGTHVFDPDDSGAYQNYIDPTLDELAERLLRDEPVAAGLDQERARPRRPVLLCAVDSDPLGVTNDRRTLWRRR